MKHFDPWIRLVAAVLSVVLLIGFVPADATATDETPEEIFLEAVGPQYEEIQYREENVKHFNMGDGTYQAIAYSHPVHKKDSQGNWQDLDFTLKRSTQRSGNLVYSSEVNNAAFAASYEKGQPLMTLTDTEGSVSFSVMTPASEKVTEKRNLFAKAARVTNASQKLDTFESAQAARFESVILYEDVLPGADLKYISDGPVVSEEIIVGQKAAAYSYSFQLDMTGLYPELKDSGAVAICRNTTGEEVYILPAPIMYDALGNVSEAVTYTLTDNGNSYTLTMEADANWINDPSRSMPVTLNASYTDSSDTVYDTFVKSTEPNTPLGDRMSLWIRSNMVTYIYSPTVTIPDGMVFDSARLEAYYYFYDYVNTGSVIALARRVNYGMWSEDTLTYNSVVGQPNFGCAADILDSHQAYATSTAKYSAPCWISFDISGAARGWLNGSYPNYGISLQYDLSSENLSMPFRSSESGASFGPRIVYQYRRPYVNVQVMYDGGYGERYSDAPYRITGMLGSVAEFYMDEFGIDIDWIPPVRFISLADSCDEPYNIYCSCETCGNSYIESDGTLVLRTYHHKNIHNILYNISMPSNQSTVKMAFTGHVTCAIESGHFPDSFAGLSDYRCNVAVIANHESLNSEIKTAVHEMGHLFMAEDHYGGMKITTAEINRKYNTDSYSKECIYGENGKNLDKPSMCAGCRKTIADNWRRFVPDEDIIE